MRVLLPTEAAPEKLYSLKTLSIVRHAVAILFYLFAWRYLAEWYSYQQSKDYFLFSAVFLPAVLLSLGPWIWAALKDVSRSRITIAAFLVLLCLPWGEWLNYGPSVFTRHNWSQQVFEQAFFLYIVISVLERFPTLTSIFHRSIQYLGSIPRNRWILYSPAVLFFVVSVLFARFVIAQTPLVEDTAANLFQAKIFTEGKLYAPAPPVRDFLSFERDALLTLEGRWFGAYPPGLALLLSIAMLIGAEWFLCPLLGAASVAIWITYAEKWHSPKSAVLVGLLCLTSPFLLNMSSTILMHTPELFIVSAVLFLCRNETENHPGVRNQVLLAAVLCSGMLVRIFSISIFLTPILGYTIWKQFLKRNFRTPAAIAIGVIAGCVLLGAYQYQLTGSPFETGYTSKTPEHRYGFGSAYGGQVHTPTRGLETVSNNVLHLNEFLSGWFLGSVFFLLIFILTKRFEIWDKLLFVSCISLMLFYYFYFYQDLTFGPRYYYVMAPFCLLLIARLLEEVQTQDGWFRIVPALLVLSFAAGLVSKWPQAMQRFNSSYFPQGNLKKEISKVEDQKVLIFVYEPIRRDYISWNDPFLRTAIIVPDMKSNNSIAMDAFPDFQPLYYRLQTDFNSGTVQTSFGLFPDQDPRPPGYVSLFHLAMVLTSAAKHDSLDAFDYSYVSFFGFSDAQRQINYLDDQLSIQPSRMNLQSYFREGLIRTGLMLLIPKAAVEQHPANWQRSFDPEQMREQFTLAVQCFKRSGEVGKAMIEQLEKVRRRIDQNADGELTDVEISRFAGEKTKIVTYGLL